MLQPGERAAIGLFGLIEALELPQGFSQAARCCTGLRVPAVGSGPLVELDLLRLKGGRFLQELLAQGLEGAPPALEAKNGMPMNFVRTSSRASRVRPRFRIERSRLCVKSASGGWQGNGPVAGREARRCRQPGARRRSRLNAATIGLRRAHHSQARLPARLTGRGDDRLLLPEPSLQVLRHAQETRGVATMGGPWPEQVRQMVSECRDRPPGRRGSAGSGTCERTWSRVSSAWRSCHGTGGGRRASRRGSAPRPWTSVAVVIPPPGAGWPAPALRM